MNELSTQIESRMDSKFDGGLLGLIGVELVTAIFAFLTFGLALPWLVCYKERWYADHTVINGKRLEFYGNGGALFGKYIIWFLLIIVTLGIYSFWVAIKMKQWTVEHTRFA